VEFNGRPTASGEIFNSSQSTAAHPTLPFGTLLTVTNMNNGRKVNVRVNDRGPFVSSRIIDLSQAAAQMLDMVSSGTAPVVVEIMENTAAYSQGTGGMYQAEANTNAVSQGGYTSATSQIIAPYPSYQSPVQTPVYQNPPVQSGEPVVVQVQPPQQQITQYFQQPVQQATQPQIPQQPVQQQPVQTPRQVQQAPQQQVQPIQQVLPVQQVIQPVQPIVQPVITPQQPSQPAQPAVQAVPASPQVQTAQPVQINIPIEVRPMVSSEPIVIPAPRVESPAAEPATPATATPVTVTPATATPPAAPPATTPATTTPITATPATATPATTPAAPVIKPNRIYRVQVGSFREVRNALAAAERLKNAGLNPVYERNGDLFRVVLSGIPSEEVSGILQKLGIAGFENPLLREEH
jgi:rare lipoprotein A (peptidoglycan hydrolase)